MFAGTGGLLDGFEQTGLYNCLAAVEWSKPQVNNLRHRWQTKYNATDAEQRVLHFDIQRTDELIKGWADDEYGSSTGLDNLIGKNHIDIISGGPPCQSYSLAGRIRDENGMRDDYRNFLFEAYIKLVDYYQPKLVVFENVEGILSAIPNGKKITDLIRADFDDAGYEIIDDLRKYALLNLKRVIIIGIRRDNANTDYQNLLKKFYTEYVDKIKVKTVKTVRDAIGDLPPIFPLKEPLKRIAYDNNSDINGHKSRFHNSRDQQIFSVLAKDIEDGENKYASSRSLIELYYEMTGRKTNIHKYHVLKWDEPSNTIPAHLKKDGLRHIHPDPLQKRSITVREAARIQTFDDDFDFIESMVSSYEMIGNAVPPFFAKKLGDSLYEFNIDIKKAEV